MAYDFNYLSKNEGLLKVTANQSRTVYCIYGNISETVPDKSRCFYEPLIGSDIWPIEQKQFRCRKGHSLLQAFSNVIFLYSCTADDKILTDIVHWEVPLQ